MTWLEAKKKNWQSTQIDDYVTLYQNKLTILIIPAEENNNKNQQIQKKLCDCHFISIFQQYQDHSSFRNRK